MVGTYATIVWASEVCFGVEFLRQFAGFQVMPTALVVLHVGRDKHFLGTVFRTALQHVNTFILEDHLGIHAAQTSAAKALGEIVIDVVAFRHWVGSGGEGKAKRDNSTGYQPHKPVGSKIGGGTPEAAA